MRGNRRDPNSGRGVSPLIWKQQRRDAAATCADETMKPTGESPSLKELRYSQVAKGNCVPARAGGEQSEAKDRPRTQVNSIRPLHKASWPGNRISREAGWCWRSPCRKACPQRRENAAMPWRFVQGGWSEDGWSEDGWSEDGWSEDGWSEDGWSEDGWKVSWVKSGPLTERRTPAGGRALIVAMKRVTTVERRRVG
jgi:hypothetical protein